MFGVVPVVNNSTGMNELFKASPTLVISDWERGLTAQELAQFRVKTKSRKIILYHYWRDKIQCKKMAILRQR